ncbi:glycosyltransferase [Geomesophilobacter sediminis]|uniref:Glycosyltransferase n=1 Tax=Geomesophilobacter sediminis TaxID=2798584 RepID=A0A8J7INL0_9BACT|nr:glycosyltransferase [Geomesophilobacter sediminis]MBJ6723679.1 glycosyltransferase [Geomesophilobacter sediminis]
MPTGSITSAHGAGSPAGRVCVLNVVFIIYDLERGGPEMRLLSFARHLPRDIRMHVLVTSSQVSMLEEFRQCGVPVTVIHIDRPWLEPGKLRQVADYCKAVSADVINIFDLKGLIIAGYLKLHGVKTPTVYNHVNSLQMLGAFKHAAVKALFRFTDYFICNSDYSKKQIDSYIDPGRIHVVYNGVDVQKFSLDLAVKNRVREELGVPGPCTLLGIVANLRREKNPDFLIDSFHRLSRRHDAVKLLCVGGGALLDHAKEKVRSLGMEERVLFTGYTKDVATYLQAIDIMVLTSISEGFPTVILEAMSMGIPVISSNVGGCPEIVRSGVNGILFDVNNADGFVEAVESVLNDRDRYRSLSAEAIGTVRSSFTIETMIAGYTRCYREFANVAGSRSQMLDLRGTDLSDE